MTDTQQFCTFFVDDLFLGVEVERVQEVIRHQKTTRVPLATQAIGGLINLRGQIVTAIALRSRLELPERQDQRELMNVVVRTEDGAVSLLVDEIGDVVEVDQDDFEPPPDTLQGTAREMIRGAFKMKDKLLLCLDTQCAIRGFRSADAAA
ncbi:MAG TPA: chemotaxis protein CheW [Terriglobales bacterium]|nr:chemotaxis protein CheW [Terriglobales bacterium]